MPASAQEGSAVSPLRPVILILIGSLGNQSSSVISSTLFAQLGTVAVSTLRLALSAAFLFVIFRPRLTKLSRERWINAVIYGAAMAAMNQFFFAAVARIPLGRRGHIGLPRAVLSVVFGIKFWQGRVWALVAFAGIVLITGPSSGLDPLGITFGLIGEASLLPTLCSLNALEKPKAGLGT